ncbi:MAG: 50S ribosomal protein L24e [Nanoarchaeota archaeon]
MPKCSYCAKVYMQGKGKIFVTAEGKIFNFCSSKCESNYELGRNPRKVKWIRKKK